MLADENCGTYLTYVEDNSITNLLIGDEAGATTGTPVARLTRADGSYPSGVPGVDINGDQALSGENSNTYIEFKLLV